MDVEEIEVLVTLKSGDTTWPKGTILKAPFVAAIQEEIRADVGTIAIRRRKGEPAYVDSAQSPSPQVNAQMQQASAALEAAGVEIDNLKVEIGLLKAKINVLEEGAGTPSDDDEFEALKSENEELKAKIQIIQSGVADAVDVTPEELDAVIGSLSEGAKKEVSKKNAGKLKR